MDSSLRKSEAGFYLFGFDRRSFKTLHNQIPELKNAISTQRRCENEVLCGIPHYHVYYTGNAFKNYWIPVDEVPIFSRKPELKLISAQSITRRRIRYNFVMKGERKRN